ncbi:hypothetical protein Q7P37_000943 [Cladosporium fusiforme]
MANPNLQQYPGDDLIPDASMIYDQTKTIHALPPDIWPWLVQLGKGRAGWYCPAWLERWLPQSWLASRAINPNWQSLAVGDRVDDYGFSKDDYFDVARLEPGRTLVYRSERYGCLFTWALLLREADDSMAPPTTTVHLRFRGRIAATGLKRRLIVWFGSVMDHISTAPMLAGLKERAERVHGQ